MGGGYYYPDLFARERPRRWELLAQHARHTWALMQRTGTHIIGFNMAKLDSPDALRSVPGLRRPDRQSAGDHGLAV